MLTTLRAALSVVMLLGFYLFALAIVGALGWLSVFLWQGHGGAGAAKVSYLTIIVAGAVLYGLWRVIRSKPEAESGVPIRSAQAPELWQMVHELAQTAQTRVPDTILLIPPVNAAVSEDTRLLGLLGGRRRLYLGAPLLQGLTVAQLRSVLAHELGHYSRRHTRLGEIVYRGRDAIGATLAMLSGRFIGWILKLYARLYLLAAAAVNRRQELEADELSVRVAGRATAQSALRELPVLGAAWAFYEGRYIDPGWEAGYAPAPADFFSGFGRLLRERSDEIAHLRSAPAPDEQSKWDSHPSIAARITAMDAMAEAAAATDARPAVSLLPGFDQACTALATSSIDYGGRTQLPWDEFTAVSVLVHEQREADRIYRAAARVLGMPGASLENVLGLTAAGRLGELAVQLYPNATRREAQQLFAESMGLLLRVAAVRSGAARWRHSWTGSAELVAAGGVALDLSDIAKAALSPDTLADARRRLAGLRIDVGAAVQVDTAATAAGGEIVGGLANVKVDGKPHDVLILDNGLILQPCPKSTDGGKDRMLEFVRSAPVAQLAKAGTFVAYEEISSATIDKTSPVRVSLTLRDGRRMTLAEAWTGDRLTKESADVLQAAVKPYVGVR